MTSFKPFARIRYAVLLLMLILVIGIVGFSAIEGYDLLESFFMTVITISTVGFNEIHPLSDGGRIFTAILIIISFGTFAYAISAITSYFVNGEFKALFKSYKMTNEIKKLKNHVIVCGYGRNGHQAVYELNASGKYVVVIENDPELLEGTQNTDKCIFLQGDATKDEVLVQANLEEAQAIITTLPNDAENLFVVLTAREMNQSMTIIARASDDSSDKKLRRAGANNVIMPDKIGGAHMASLIVKPDVIEFIDYIVGQGSSSFHLEEINFENLPEKFKHKSIKELDVRNLTGANIVGFKTSEGEYRINPSPEEVMNPDDKLFVLGTNEQLAKLRETLEA